MQSEVIVADAPRKLVIAWNNTGNVTFELEPHGEGVLLTLTHAGFQTRSSLIGHSAGWHAHLDVLEALAFEREPEGLLAAPGRPFAANMAIACQPISEPEPCARCAFRRWAGLRSAEEPGAARSPD